MTAQQFREALAATLPLTDWTDEMVQGDWAAARRRATEPPTRTRAALATVWYLGPENEPRRAAEVST